MRRLYIPEKSVVYTDENGKVYTISTSDCAPAACLNVRDVDGEQVSFTNSELRGLFRALKKHGWEGDKPND